MKLNTNDLCEQYLKILYHDDTFFYMPANIAETQGEIFYRSINKLIPYMQITEKDIFVDLGSGNGKVVLQMFLSTAIKVAIGIEIIPELHSKAITISNRIKTDLPHFFSNDRTLLFLNEDFLKIPLDNITIAFTNATCFPPNLINELGEIINNTPSIRTVFSLRPIPTLQRLRFKKAITVECSWDTTICYLYNKS